MRGVHHFGWEPSIGSEVARSKGQMACVRLRPKVDFFLIGPWVRMEFGRDRYLALG